MRQLHTCLALLALSAAAPAPPVYVTGAWARATLPGQTVAAVYLTLTSAQADSLVGVSSPQAARAALHLSSTSGGMAGMSDLDSLALPAGQPVQLRPMGAHIMLEGVGTLAPGGQVRVTLRFAHAGPLTVEAPVRPVGAAGP